MFEFKINFLNRTCYGDHYSVWVWLDSRWVTIVDKIYYADCEREVINAIKNEVKTMFGIKRAIWRIKR